MYVCYGNAHFYEVKLSVEPLQEEGVEEEEEDEEVSSFENLHFYGAKWPV